MIQHKQHQWLEISSGKGIVGLEVGWQENDMYLLSERLLGSARVILISLCTSRKHGLDET